MLSWRGRRGDLEKQLGFDVKKHGFPTSVEKIILE